MSLIGERLRLAREKMNLKQIQVKEKTGINNKTLSGYENGVSQPDVDSLKILAELYEVSIDWLYGNTDNPKKILKGSQELLKIIELSDEQAFEMIKKTFVHQGKTLSDDAIKEIISFARYKASQGESE